MMKTKVVIQGCGKLGSLVATEVEKRKDMQVVAGIDASESQQFNFPVFQSLDEDAVGCDVIIDGSSPEALSSFLGYAIKWEVPLVIGTTGHSEQQRKEIAKASEQIPILMASNFSIGATLLIKFIAATVRYYQELGVNVEVEITEWHHTRKKDAPSGTAKTIKERIQSVRGTAEDIPIESIREGDIIGIHEVKMTAGKEILRFSHEVVDRIAFAQGAVNAAKFIVGKAPGLYSMNDLFNI